MEIKNVADIKNKLGYEITSADKLLYYDTILKNPYIPIEPYPKQILNFLLANRRDTDLNQVLTGGKAYGGKELALDTLIPTPDGFKELQDLVVSDEVFDENGNICHLTHKSEIYFDHECYKITFKCGEEIIAGEKHWWVASSPNERWKDKESLYTTKELFEKHQELQNQKNSENMMIKNPKPIMLDNKKYEIDPYLLGLWLGNGSNNGEIFTTSDKELLIPFKEKYKVKYLSKYDYSVEKLTKDLRKYNLIDNKHIPNEYLRGSYEQRLSLVQGLMDVNGIVSKEGKCEFIQKNYEIIEGLQELLFTLGIETTINENSKKPQTISEKRKHYRITFRTTLPIFRLKRKLDRIPDNIRKDRKYQSIVNIEKVETVPTQCIAVDSPNHMFLCGKNFIPTHNTYILTALALQYVNEKNYRCLIARKNFGDLVGVTSIYDNIENWTSDMEGVKPKRNAPFKFKFTSGAEIHFLAFDRPEKRNKIRGTSFHRIIVDESSQLHEETLRYLFRSLRKNNEDPIPLSAIFASNPLGISNQYHIDKFVSEKAPNPYISLGYTDNPFIDQKAYERSLMELPRIDRISQMMGDWSISLEDGLLMSGEEFDSVVIPEMPCESVYNLVSVDYASTGTDMTALTSICLGTNGKKYLVRTKLLPDSHIEQPIIRFVQEEYNKYKTYYCVGEQEVGSASTYSARYWEDMFKEYLPQVLYTSERPIVSKFERSRPTAMEIINKNLYIVEDENTPELREQFMYIHPDKKIMGERKSPDLLDSLNQGLYVLNSNCGIGMVGKGMFASKR